MRRWLFVLGFAASAVVGASAPGFAQSAPGAVAPDLCIQARADWPSVQRSVSAPVLQAYRDSLPAACVVQRALVDARMKEVGANASGGYGVAQNGARTARARYHCANDENVRVTFDRLARTAVVYRFARPQVRLMQTDAPSGFRYVRSGGFLLEGDGSTVRISWGPTERLVCEKR